MAVGVSKQENIAQAVKFIHEAATAGANIVALPECFNSPYGTKHFPDYAEPIPGPSTNALAVAAKDNSVFVVGGSFPERDEDKFYNTCAIFNPQGQLITTHRKVHLFDIDVPGKICFKESEVLSPGNHLTMFTTRCSLLLYPGAFNMTTGPAHWEILQRSRALDNQVFVATASPARDETADYIAWGHSTVVDPWGEVIATTDEKESIVYAEIDLTRMAEIRKMIPLCNQRRYDLYHPPSVQLDKCQDYLY